MNRLLAASGFSGCCRLLRAAGNTGFKRKDIKQHLEWLTHELVEGHQLLLWVYAEKENLISLSQADMDVQVLKHIASVRDATLHILIDGAQGCQLPYELFASRDGDTVSGSFSGRFNISKAFRGRRRKNRVVQICCNRAATPGVLSALFIDILSKRPTISYPQLLFQMQHTLEILAPGKGSASSPCRYVVPDNATHRALTGQLAQMRALRDVVTSSTTIKLACTLFDSVLSTHKGCRRKDACQRMKEEFVIASVARVPCNENVRFGS